MHWIAVLLVATAFSTRVTAVASRPFIHEGDDVFVTTENGVLRGVVAKSVDGMLYNQFRGIPYAAPPVGDLRFRAPRPAPSWSGVRDARSFGSVCPQPVAGGSEDCLFLDVYMPAAHSGPFPVMVFVHGGGFSSGASLFSTPHYFVENGVGLVSINYRLGALGFLSLQNDDIPGNAGLKDQVMALRWVQRNIAAFGGDPSRVVIYGDSAGAGSTSHLFLSPAAKGLISGAIMSSGVATTYWALTDQSRQRAYRMAAALGFEAQGDHHTDVDDAQLAAFLRAANYSHLTDDDSIALSDFERRAPSPIAFVPVVEPPSDSAVITESPADILRTGSYNQVPIMLGVTSAEGGIVTPNVLTEAGIADMRENFTLLVGSQLPLPTEEQRTRVAQKLEHFYFGDEGFSTNNMQALTDLFSDMYFIQPAESFARAVANSSSLPVYLYYFNYNGTGSSQYGMMHCGENLYLFPRPRIGLIMDPSSDDGMVARQLTVLWKDFVKYGDPAPSGSSMVWEALTANASNYLDMKLEFVTRQELLKERMDFWREILST